jgi:hypothetical protein
MLAVILKKETNYLLQIKSPNALGYSKAKEKGSQLLPAF